MPLCAFFMGPNIESLPFVYCFHRFPELLQAMNGTSKLEDGQRPGSKVQGLCGLALKMLGVWGLA